MNRLYFNEVVTRDGFQSEPAFVPTDQKIALVDSLSECGFSKIEVTSFTSPKAIPMLRDAAEVMKGIRRQGGVKYTVLVPNVRGAERALEADVDELNLVMSASDSHNLANLRMPMEKSFESLSEIVHTVAGRTSINVSLSCSFGCPMEGRVAQSSVIDRVQRFIDLGVQEITLCDTTGMAHPESVRSMAEAMQSLSEQLRVTMHFHNTRGMGVANILAAVQGGITSFDGSLGGLGGCPYAPGATGNVCTEDAIHMLHAMGYQTGVDLERLLEIAGRLPDIVGHEVPGQVVKAGAIRY